MSDKFKKLTSKNPNDFEEVAYSLINLPDTELFSELVDKDDFLFDFVKQNVVKRLEKVCNETNYLNLVKFLKYYCPTYEDFIVSNLVRYSDEDLTDKMLEIFEAGTDDEKNYCAKYFEYVQDSLAVPLLNKYAFENNSSLGANCASALSKMNEKEAYDMALSFLKSDDEFKNLDGVKFLVAYGDESAVGKIIETMKTSAFAENIASELPYLKSLFDIYKTNSEDGLYIANLIINSLGEVVDLSQIFDYDLYGFLEMLICGNINSRIASVLLNAIERFETLTENDEYLFDQQKDVKQEVLDIKNLLKTADITSLYRLIDMELNPDSLFVFTALEFSENEEKIRELLTSGVPAVVLKSLEALKQMEVLTNNDKETALAGITDENIKNIVKAL